MNRTLNAGYRHRLLFRQPPMPQQPLLFWGIKSDSQTTKHLLGPRKPVCVWGAWNHTWNLRDYGAPQWAMRLAAVIPGLYQVLSPEMPLSAGSPDPPERGCIPAPGPMQHICRLTRNFPLLLMLSQMGLCSVISVVTQSR